MKKIKLLSFLLTCIATACQTSLIPIQPIGQCQAGYAKDQFISSENFEARKIRALQQIEQQYQNYPQEVIETLKSLPELDPTDKDSYRTDLPGYRDVQVLRLGIPNYPHTAAAEGLQGECETQFGVGPQGEVFGVLTICTDDVFRMYAEEIIRSAVFVPATYEGQPVPRLNIVQPAVFCLTE